MTGANWLQLAALIALVVACSPLLGSYMAKVFGGATAPGDRVFLPIERAIYRLTGVDPSQEQRWPRTLQLDEVLQLIDEQTSGRPFGFLGEPGVNVLLLNLAIDDLATTN